MNEEQLLFLQQLKKDIEDAIAGTTTYEQVIDKIEESLEVSPEP